MTTDTTTDAPPSAPAHPITRWLEGSSTQVFSAFAILTAFGIYFSMYAFRKSFAAGEFIGVVTLPFLPALKLKSFYVISQVFGYCLSKFVGIKVISELSASKRAMMILGVIGLAELALLLFAITPAPWSALWLFLNGAPLGMVWGLVFGFLEGRKLSELLGAGLSASYIIASGFVKSAGSAVMSGWEVSERWMPAVTGLLFLLPFALCVFLLQQLPAPSAADEAARMRRLPMDRAARGDFLRRFAPGLGSLTLLYFFLTAYRDFRDNFARELWEALGYGDAPAIFALSELPVAFGVMVALALLVLIKDNRKALLAVHFVMLGGVALIGLSTLAFQLQWISGVVWMITVGLGAYLAYVPFGSMLFDRLIATFGICGTAGFMIYVTDAFGYLGSVGVNLYKNFGPERSWLDFFISLSLFTAALCGICFLLSLWYFARRSREAGEARGDLAAG